MCGESDLKTAIAMLIMPLVALTFMAFDAAQDQGWLNVISIASVIMLVLGIFVSYRSFGLFWRKEEAASTPGEQTAGR